ncbi:DUF4124 domain-containing protein [Aquipseudomonas ullengensis]|uniref:DUF4124 domain-containing protein n=1 Tax=Aquipseudomonas ullengensis TaxID=2759166 RepID=A0A7W4LKB6_9GAMM|nr:DUF4124 domain-containing protein [Pseudomonas ullengensis]MBB2494755.1 DUF4124 domain-containing protein [Pseudomonas ullengensis]
MRKLLWSVLLLPGLAGAEIYRWTDASGQVHFSEKPAGAGAQQVEVKPQVVERDDATRQREERTAQFYDARRQEKAQADAKSAEAQAKRSQECKKLRGQLADIQRGGRYFVTDKNGERSYIDPKEVDDARNRLSSRISERCS